MPEVWDGGTNYSAISHWNLHWSRVGANVALISQQLNKVGFSSSYILYIFLYICFWKKSPQPYMFSHFSVFACLFVWVLLPTCLSVCLHADSLFFQSYSAYCAVRGHVHQKRHFNTLSKYSPKKAKKHFNYLWRAFSMEVEELDSPRGKYVIMLVCLD